MREGDGAGKVSSHGRTNRAYTMNDETKNKLTSMLHHAAAEGAEKASEQAKASKGWKRWLWSIGAAIAAAIAWFTAAPL